MIIITQQELKTKALTDSLPFKVGQKFEVEEVGITCLHKPTGVKRKGIFTLLSAKCFYHQGVWEESLCFETEDRAFIKHPKDMVAIMHSSPGDVGKTSTAFANGTDLVLRTFTLL